MDTKELIESIIKSCKKQKMGCNPKCPFYRMSQYDVCALTSDNPKYWNVEDMAMRFNYAMIVGGD